MKPILNTVLFLCISVITYSQSNISFSKIGSSSGNDEGRKSVIDDSDNVYICGFFEKTCYFSNTITKTSAGGTDVYLAKYNCQGVLQWVQTFGGVYNEHTAMHFLGLDIDNQNNILISGSINNSGTITSQNGSNVSITTTGGSDAIIVKYSKAGDIIWHKKFGGSGLDDASNVKVNQSNNDVIVTGYFNSASLVIGSTTLLNAGNEDVFLCKLDASGNEQWAIRFGGVGYETSNHSMSVDLNGNIYLGSNTDNTLSLGTKTMTHFGSWGGFFLMYNTNGVLQWVLRTSNTGSSGGQGIISDGNGNAYILSMFSNTVTYTDNGGSTLALTSTTVGKNDLALMKIDPAGNIVWSKRTSGNGAKTGLTICLDSYKNLYLSGAYQGALTFNSVSSNSVGTLDAFIIKTDSNGNSPIIKSFGGVGSTNFANHVNISNKNKISVIGDFTKATNFGGTNFSPYGLQDAFLLIDNNDSTYNFLPNDTSVNGNTFTITPNTNGLSYLWTPGDDVTQSLTVTTSGWYKLRIEKNCSYYYDSIYVSLSTSNGINKNKSSITRIFPNPSNGLFLISSESTVNFIEVYDVHGKKIVESNINNGNLVNLTEFDNGIYYLTYLSNGIKITNRLVLIK